jgi:Leucine Rich repeat
MMKQQLKDREAVEALVKLGGRVLYNNPANPSEPSWFLEWAGECSVSRVDFSGHSEVTDAGLVQLEELTQLRSLDLTRTEVTDVGLVLLKGLINLQTLELARTNVTNAGVGDLQTALPNCQISH